MPVETAADRAIFVDPEDFGAAVTWTKQGGGASALSAIFDADYQLLTGPFLEEGQEGAQPMITVRSSDVPSGAAQGDTITVTAESIPGGSGSFKVVELKPDGTGMTVVRLSET